MENNRELVVCEGLTKVYGSLTALDHLDLKQEGGRFIGLAGAERLGQDHGHQAAQRPDPADRGHRADRR